MNDAFLAAAGLTALSLVGYVAGTLSPYPGREASLAGLIVGVTLLAVTYGDGSDSAPMGDDAATVDAVTGDAVTGDRGAGGRADSGPEDGRPDGGGRANGGAGGPNGGGSP